MLIPLNSHPRAVASAFALAACDPVRESFFQGREVGGRGQGQR
jgi:hypothetical protein